jgi:hypothetical protein
VEVYRLDQDGQPTPNRDTVPAVAEWGLVSEPWLFVVGADGRLVDKFEGSITVEEVRPAIERAIADARTAGGATSDVRALPRLETRNSKLETRNWPFGVRPASLAIAALVVVGAIAAITLTRANAPSSEAEVRGVLVDVQSREIVRADALTVRDAAGTLYTFGVSPEVAENSDHPVTAAHLRQHMTAGDPVLVRYRSTPEGPIAVRVLDAASPSPPSP